MMYTALSRAGIMLIACLTIGASANAQRLKHVTLAVGTSVLSVG
jgi:hypothetical protein